MASPWDVERTRAAWWLFGLAIGLAMLFVVYSFIGTFVFGIFIYYATRPVYIRLRRRIRPASLAAAVSLTVLALPAILLLAYSLAIGLQEATRFAERFDVAGIEPIIQPYLDVSSVPRTPAELIDADGIEAIPEVVIALGDYLGFVGTAALHLFVMIAIAFYLLRDGNRLARWTRRRFGDDAGVLEAYARAVDRSFHQIFFGNILNAVLTATIGVLSYNILNLFAPAAISIPYPSLIGLLAGIASLVPIVGMKLVYVPVTIYLVVATFLVDAPAAIWFVALFAGVSFVVVDTIPDLTLRPYVSGRDLHVGMVMFAYILGPLLFGWYGIFLGPMILVLVIHFARIVLPELLAGVPIQPIAVDPTHLTEAAVEPSDGGDEGADADG